MSFLFFVLSLVFAFSTKVNLVAGYKIDQSCRNAGIYDEIRTALHEAFDMAEAGVAAIERGQPRHKKDPAEASRVDHNWSEVPPRPSVLQDLIKNLFAHDDIINESQDLDLIPHIPDPPADLPDAERQFILDSIRGALEEKPYKQTMRNIKLKNVYNSLKGILLNMKKPGENPVKLASNDSVIYCDTSRYELQKGLWVYDKENKIKLGFLNKKQCFGPGDKIWTLATTYSSRPIPGTNNWTPNMIQLCPPLIREIKRAQARRERSILRFVFGKISSSINFHLGMRQIDILGNSLAVTLLHEMTHGLGGGSTNDVKVSMTGLLQFFKVEAYGWDKQKRLAKTRPYVDQWSLKACDNNADSIAYFALGCKLMSDSENPQRIEEDGSVVPLDNPVTWTPDNWKRRWYEAAGIRLL